MEIGSLPHARRIETADLLCSLVFSSLETVSAIKKYFQVSDNYKFQNTGDYKAKVKETNQWKRGKQG